MFFKLCVATEAGTRCQGRNTNSGTTETLPGPQGQSVSQRMCPGGAGYQVMSYSQDVSFILFRRKMFNILQYFVRVIFWFSRCLVACSGIIK